MLIEFLSVEVQRERSEVSPSGVYNHHHLCNKDDLWSLKFVN